MGHLSSALLDQNFRTPRGGNNDDKADPQIHPVNYVNIDSLHRKQARRRYTNTLLEDIWHVVQTITQRVSKLQRHCNGVTEIFTASGLPVLERNYLDVYPYRSWEIHKAIAFIHRR